MVFSGRLDNRSDLAEALQIKVAELASLSDTRLLLRAFIRWRERCFERLLGPFAVAVVDERSGAVTCARDALGDRGLFYALDERFLAVASEECALLRLPWVSSAIDETTMARFFALQPPSRGATFFRGVRELPPATGMTVERGRSVEWTHWAPEVETAASKRKDREYVEEFRELVDQSVAVRLRSVGPPAVMLSGGLDSTTVTALAARRLPQALTTVSYVFNELTACDERRFMDPLVERYGLRSIRFVGDGEWPLRDLQTWTRNPNTPREGTVRRLRDSAYSLVRADQTRTLLTGEFGDHLYAGGQYWLRDLAAAGGFGTALRELAADPWRHRLGRAPRVYRLRPAVGRLVGWRKGARPSAPWLTEEARQLVAEPDVGASTEWQGVLFDPRWAMGNVIASRQAAAYGLEVRRPFRDRRLIEFGLRLPRSLVYRPGETKWILRRAMRGVLPEPIRQRRWATSLLPLVKRGLCEREADTVRGILGDPDGPWRRYVRQDWLQDMVDVRLPELADGREMVTVWHCLCAAIWRTAATSRSLAPRHNGQVS